MYGIIYSNDKRGNSMSYQIKCIPEFDPRVSDPILSHLVSIEDDSYIFGYTESSEVATWDTREEVLEVLEWLRKEERSLLPGELSYPEFGIIKDFDIGPDCIKGNYKHVIEEKEIPSKVKKKLDAGTITSLCPYKGNHVTYGYCVIMNKWQYCKLYTVNSLAVQLNQSNAGWINLQHAVYTCVDV